MNFEFRRPEPGEAAEKFANPDRTAKGEPRAKVALTRLETLWINTGTLCNIECVNCYIASSPTNDRLEYIRADELKTLLDEVESLGLATREIAFTGGEPFMNPDMIAMADDALARGFEVLILTNAMQPMQRPRVMAGLKDLRDRYADRLTLRVSLDHFTGTLHESERGKATWEKALDGLDWLAREGFRIAIAGRTCWDEDEEASRTGYADLIRTQGWPIDPADRDRLVLLPEMDGSYDVPEISTACWNILGKRPRDMMCATSRMVVKRKGADRPTLVPCTLLPYEPEFEMGATLTDMLAADGAMFDRGAVKLCHPHCAKFCVLGGGSCS